MSLLTALLIMILIWLPYDVSGFPSGAPPKACDTMIPGHHVEPQTTACPYKLHLDKTSIKPGEQVTMTLEGGSFKGFLIIVKKQGENTAQGTWVGGAKAQEIAGCSEGMGVTHNNNIEKKSITVTWSSPNVKEANGVYQVFFTVVQQKETFWVKQETKSMITIGDGQKSKKNGASSRFQASKLPVSIMMMMVSSVIFRRSLLLSLY